MKMLIPVSTTCHLVEPRTPMSRVSSPVSFVRKAFTLIELLVVIAVIAILASLLVVGVNKAINFSRQVGVKTEMAQIEVALANAARELGNVPYIPSRIRLYEDLTDTNVSDPGSLRLLQMMFPGATQVDWNLNGPTPNATADSDPSYTLNAAQSWVFFLGGMKVNGEYVGFARGNNPADISSTKRKGPFYDFKKARIKPNGTYLDSWEKNVLLVYANISRDPASADIDNPGSAFPGRYFSSTTKLFNSKGYQIISAGKDGVFGVSKARIFGTTIPIVFNGYGDLETPGGSDDQANFSDSVLAKPVD